MPLVNRILEELCISDAYSKHIVQRYYTKYYKFHSFTKFPHFQRDEARS